MYPPCVGSGCSVTSVATGSRSAGSASSPTSVSPSAVCSSTSSRRAGRTVSERIGVGPDASAPVVAGSGAVLTGPSLVRSPRAAPPARRPARRVPGAEVVERRLGAEERVVLPGHHVAGARRDLLVAARAQVGLGPAAHRAHLPLAVGPGLAPCAAEGAVEVEGRGLRAPGSLAGRSTGRHAPILPRVAAPARECPARRPLPAGAQA